MTLNIRSAEVRDTTQLAALALQVWLDTYATTGIRESMARYVLQAFTPNHFERLLTDPDRHIMVAERDQHLLGYAVLSENRSCPLGGHANFAELETVYVARHFHRQRVGSLLLQMTDQRALEVGAAGIWLTCWRHNEAALAFYGQYGFVDAGHTYFEMEGEQHENRVLVRPLYDKTHYAQLLR